MSCYSSIFTSWEETSAVRGLMWRWKVGRIRFDDHTILSVNRLHRLHFHLHFPFFRHLFFLFIWFKWQSTREKIKRAWMAFGGLRWSVQYELVLVIHNFSPRWWMIIEECPLTCHYKHKLDAVLFKNENKNGINECGSFSNLLWF